MFWDPTQNGRGGRVELDTLHGPGTEYFMRPVLCNSNSVEIGGKGVWRETIASKLVRKCRVGGGADFYMVYGLGNFK